ncbi:hypothetical protein A2U01_0022092, partial [Trifolium medium]|nr:hypothetical protein [Trifolium medium]
MARTKNIGRRPAPPSPPPTNRDEPSLPPAPPFSFNSETVSNTFTTAPNSDIEINQQEITLKSSVDIGSPEKLIAETIVKMSQIETSKSTTHRSDPIPKPTIVYTKSKSKSTNTQTVRRFARIQSGIGTAKNTSIDKTIYEIIDDNSEEDEASI